MKQQSNPAMMHMCDKNTAAKASSPSIVKSGITCNTCGGIGHYARSCPTKSKPALPGQSVKVHVAVAKSVRRIITISI